jgi:hypothetical protein
VARARASLTMAAMKLTDWETRFPEPELDYVQERLTALSAVEVAALYLRDDNGELRALVATNIAQVDCAYAMDDKGLKPASRSA